MKTETLNSIKKAVLVTVSVTTRIIVDQDMTEEQIGQIALPRLVENLLCDGFGDHMEEIKDDVECPFGTFDIDKELNSNRIS